MILGLALLVGLVLSPAAYPAGPFSPPAPLDRDVEAVMHDPLGTLHGRELGPGDVGRAVTRVQELLAAHGLFRGPVDGEYGRATAAAVVALHKLADVERDAAWHPEDVDRLARIDGTPILALHPDEPDRVEVDLDRQVLFVIRDGEVAAIVPVSSGNGARYWSKNGGWVRARTPRGDFRLFKHIRGWRHNYLGALYEPWYFTPYYAIHGSRRVPARPASHGCVRVQIWDAAAIRGMLFLGMPVHIWVGGPSVVQELSAADRPGPSSSAVPRPSHRARSVDRSSRSVIAAVA